MHDLIRVGRPLLTAEWGGRREEQKKGRLYEVCLEKTQSSCGGGLGTGCPKFSCSRLT